MSDLVGNPEDQFSRVMKHFSIYGHTKRYLTLLTNTAVCLYLLVRGIGADALVSSCQILTYHIVTLWTKIGRTCLTFIYVCKKKKHIHFIQVEFCMSHPLFHLLSSPFVTSR